MEVFRRSYLRTQIRDLRRIRVALWIELLGAVFKPPILHLGGVRFARPKPEGRHRFAKWRVARIDLASMDEEIVHRKCSINGETFIKEWAVG